MNPARRRTSTATATAVVLATAGGLLTTAAVPAVAATNCASPVYKRQFYANTAFSGTPKRTDCDSVIDENWGAKAPASGLPTNNFAVRWSVTRDFGSGGPFTLAVAAQDGIRVYVDNSRKVDLWKNGSTTTKKTVNVTIPAGKHTLRVDYVNWTGSANVKLAYAPNTSATVDKVRPRTPAGVTWDYVPESPTEVVAYLVWARNQEMDLAGYRIYRQAEGTSTWTKVGTTTQLAFGDRPPCTGQKYYYQVRAYDKAGNESTGAASKGPVPSPDVTPPGTPVLTATATQDANDLSWTASADAVRYQVYGKLASASRYTLLTETTATGYRHSPVQYGKVYEYKVSAVDTAGNTADSAIAQATPTITVPSGVTLSSTDWGVQVTWKEPAGGDTADYRVYRSAASADGSRQWTLARCNTPRTSTDADGNTIRSCHDNDVRHGETYHYKLHRQNTAGLWSTGSAEVTITTSGDEVPPPPVTGLHAEPLEYGVKLDWDDATVADLDEYWIYRRGPYAGTHEFVAEVDAGTSEYLDGPYGAHGDSRTYFVVAVDRYGNSLTYEDEIGGEWSPTITGTDVTQLDLTPSEIPAETAPCWLYSDATSTGAGILSIDCEAADSLGVHVYRWDRAAGRWARLTDVPLAPTTTRYLDLDAPTGTTNHYVLSVVAPDGTEAFSNVDWAASLPRPA
ncbi:PA14 domain-containing protein [Streptomyces sp. NPDC002306]